MNLIRSLLLAAALLPLAVHAVTLGEARVKSFLNQPLDLEIDLIGLAPGQHQDVRVRIANQVHFDRLGIVYEHFLSDLQFDIVGRDSNWIVRARSSRPIAEPFLDFPLQMTWPGGQLVKQYTLLLDPPGRIDQATRAARPPRADSGAAPAGLAAPLGADENYGPVQRGETLWPIAQKLRPQGITTRQMAMALLRANPQAFIDGDINKLRAGAVLQVPPLAFIEELDPAAAQREFAAQAQRRQPPVNIAPREQAATVPQTAVAPAADAAAGTADGMPPPAATEPADPEPQLRIVADDGEPASESDDPQKLKDKLLVTMEKIESNRIATDAIESRLARLEDELSRMQQLVQLKDAQIAALQSEVKAREAIDQSAALGNTKSTTGTTVPTATQAGPATGQAGAVAQPERKDEVEPKAVIEIETTSTARTNSEPVQPWYQSRLWIIWIVLGLLGLTAVAAMIRRQGKANQDFLMADLAASGKQPPRPYAAAASPAKTTQERAPEPRAAEEPPAQAPSAVPAAAAVTAATLAAEESKSTGAQTGGLTNSLLDELLDEDAGKALKAHPEPPSDEVPLDTDLGDDDIASWVDELNAEVEELSSASERIELEDEIPSILTQLDDQMGAGDKVVEPEPLPIEIDPIDEITEDDAFTMSLDLARAYLEIGDQEGARDMLKQALSGARDPAHRRQIEDLLSEID